jgi:hypothetical protein
MAPFRTATGQTGRSAYIYEASAIANAKRELDERFSRLLTVMHEEAPLTFECSSDYRPELGDGRAENAKGLLEMLLSQGERE